MSDCESQNPARLSGEQSLKKWIAMRVLKHEKDESDNFCNSSIPMSETAQSRERSPTPTNPRPYRSHKFPACDYCRHRKARCVRHIGNGPCQLCRLHKRQCTQTKAVWSQPKVDTLRSKSVKPPRAILSVGSLRRSSALSNALPTYATRESDESWRNGSREPFSEQTGVPSTDNKIPRATESSPEYQSFVVDTSQCPATENQTNHVISPALARDMQLLGQWFALGGFQRAQLQSTNTPRNPYNVVSVNPRDPIVHLSVPRRRRTALHKGCRLPGFRQFETIERILDPLGRDVLDLYFERFHPAFPLLDEKSVVDSYSEDRLSYVLTCEIYAVSLISWDLSPAISRTRRPRPEMEYIWIQTVSALKEDFASPGFSTVLSCLLDLTGRPTTSILYNSINVGKCVALSKSLGLNRDPTHWCLEERQKDFRIRAWWGVLIHDWWSSLAHGTPPHIQPSQFDVKLPQQGNIVVDNSQVSDTLNPRATGAKTFIALCELTQILGNLLPFIYDLQPRDVGESMRKLSTLENTLENWEAALPSWLRRASPGFRSEAPGALNLHLSLLATKLSLFRICLLKTPIGNEVETARVHRHYQRRSRNTAKDISDFVIQLEGKDLNVFWLPSDAKAPFLDTAYHLTSAVTMLLRCALEAESRTSSHECMVSAIRMIRHLRKLKDESSWDLADNCLEQCESLVGRMVENMYPEDQKPRAHASVGASDTSQHTSRVFERDCDDSSKKHVSQNPSDTTGGFDAYLDAALPGPPFVGLDYGMLEATQSAFWDGNFYVPVPDPWLVPGINESGNFSL